MNKLNGLLKPKQTVDMLDNGKNRIGFGLVINKIIYSKCWNTCSRGLLYTNQPHNPLELDAGSSVRSMIYDNFC